MTPVDPIRTDRLLMRAERLYLGQMSVGLFQNLCAPFSHDRADIPGNFPWIALAMRVWAALEA